MNRPLTREDREDYKIAREIEKNSRIEKPCLHDLCLECHGTGKKADGTICIHHLSCPCPKCTPVFSVR